MLDGYDDRGRLIAESRMVSSGPSPEYDLAYEYDQAGNRTMKIDALNEIEPPTSMTWTTGACSAATAIA